MLINSSHLWNSMKKMQKKNKNIKLPSVLLSSDDFYIFEKNQAEPTFITQKIFLGDLQVLTSDMTILDGGLIILIEQADPGYDWIFSHQIGGLITKYGGSNSHMAIRCAELEIPAAIGVGDAIYDELSGQNTITLDCCQKRITYE